jgi:hypothetical protein
VKIVNMLMIFFYLEEKWTRPACCGTEDFKLSSGMRVMGKTLKWHDIDETASFYYQLQPGKGAARLVSSETSHTGGF